MGGNGKFAHFVERHRVNHMIVEKDISSLMVVTDRDATSDTRIKNQINVAFDQISVESNRWKKNAVQNSFGQIKSIDTYLLIIPPNEEGALERVIIDALNDIPEETVLVQEVEQFIDALKARLVPDLNQINNANYLEKLPMFCASRYINYNREWTERARIMKSADGSERYIKSIYSGKLDQFLLRCLLFTALETQNHMCSFIGSDGKKYINELCLDDSNGETCALRDIKKLKINDKEKALIKQWKILLGEVKKTKEYNASLTYGIYQISVEIDTSYKDKITEKTVYNNVEVHTALMGVKKLLRDYYNQEIVPVLFEYEFLK